jgi:antitoxin component YwqK of YwqJK toxin-antitoxin module
VILVLVILLSGCAKDAFQKARTLDTVESYDNFLKEYPNDKEYSKNAERRKEYLFYAQCEKQKDKACQEYITLYPKGYYIKKAYEKGNLSGIAKLYYDNDNIKTEISYLNGQKEGIHLDFYENSVLESEVPYENNNIHGKVKYYYNNGKIKSIATYSNGKLNGFKKIYTDDGVLESEVPYENNNIHGEVKYYYNNGKIKSIATYSNGKLNGFKKIYTDDGVLERESFYENDLQNGFEFFYYNGYLLGSTPYRHGKVHGLEQYFYKNGSISEEAFFINNYQEGLSLKYYENGNIKTVANFKNNSTEGYVFWYYSDGKLMKRSYKINGYSADEPRNYGDFVSSISSSLFEQHNERKIHNEILLKEFLIFKKPFDDKIEFYTLFDETLFSKDEKKIASFISKFIYLSDHDVQNKIAHLNNVLKNIVEGKILVLRNTHAFSSYKEAYALSNSIIDLDGMKTTIKNENELIIYNKLQEYYLVNQNNKSRESYFKLPKPKDNFKNNENMDNTYLGNAILYDVAEMAQGKTVGQFGDNIMKALFPSSSSIQHVKFNSTLHSLAEYGKYKVKVKFTLTYLTNEEHQVLGFQNQKKYDRKYYSTAEYIVSPKATDTQILDFGNVQLSFAGSSFAALMSSKMSSVLKGFEYEIIDVQLVD